MTRPLSKSTSSQLRLVWTIWTSMSTVLKKAVKLNHSLTQLITCYLIWQGHSTKPMLTRSESTFNQVMMCCLTWQHHSTKTMLTRSESTFNQVMMCCLTWQRHYTKPMMTRSESTFNEVMMCCLTSQRHYTKPMLTSHQWFSAAFTWEKFHFKPSRKKTFENDTYKIVATSLRDQWVRSIGPYMPDVLAVL